MMFHAGPVRFWPYTTQYQLLYYLRFRNILGSTALRVTVLLLQGRFLPQPLTLSQINSHQFPHL